MKTNLNILALLLLGQLASYGQAITSSVINVSGSSAKKAGYRLDWSVGEMALAGDMQPAGASYYLSNGFIQPFEEIADPLVTHPVFTNDEIRILPNPTPGNLEVIVNTSQKGQIRMRLYDELGNLIYLKYCPAIGFEQTEHINMARYLKGTYMLHIELIPATGSTYRTGSYTIIKIDQ